MHYIAQVIYMGMLRAMVSLPGMQSTSRAGARRRKVLLATSCTHALEMASLLLDIQPGDEVIVPAFTFVSTVNVFVPAVPDRYHRIRQDTLNMDEAQLSRLITPRTYAILPVHYAGVGCEMDTICEIAANRSHRKGQCAWAVRGI